MLRQMRLHRIQQEPSKGLRLLPSEKLQERVRDFDDRSFLQPLSEYGAECSGMLILLQLFL